MPNIYVCDSLLVAAPSDANDGFDIFGINSLLTGASYNAATRTLSGGTLAGNIPDLTACFIAVTGGTGWTAGLYQIESCDPVAGTIVFPNVAGVNTSTNNVPTCSTGALATITAALAKAPATPALPYTSYGLNAAVQICLAPSGGVFSIDATLALSVYGTAAFHNRIVPALQTTGAINPPGLTARIQPSGTFTAGTPLVQLVTGTNPYYLEIDSIIFNGNANGRQASHCFDANTGNGDIAFTNCRFTAGSGNGLRIVSQRIQAHRCVTDANLTHGVYATSSANNNLRLDNCESHSNSFEGFNIEGTSEGAALIECLAHNNGRHGFSFVSSNRSTLVFRCIAAANAQHGFDLAAGVDLCLRGCVASGNGTTASHRQFNFGGTSSVARTLTFDANAAFAAGSAVITDATDLLPGQIITLAAAPLRNTAAAAFDGRLTGPARSALRSTMRRRGGVGFPTVTDAPGLSAFSLGSSGERGVPRS